MASSSDESEYEIGETISTLMMTGMMPGLGMGEESEERRELQVCSANKKRQFEDVGARLTRYHFSKDSVYDKNDLKRRIRVPHVVFEKILNGVSSLGIFYNNVML